MNQVQSESEFHNTLTPREFCLLQEIIGCYDKRDNICYYYQLSQIDKGVMGSLVKKGLVYDSFSNMDCHISNFFPSEIVLDIYGLDYYGKSC